MHHGTARPVGAIVGVIVSVGVVVGLAAPAAAHTSLKASSPKDGSSIDAAPSQVVLEFTEPILTVGYRVVVRGPDGRQYQAGAPLITNSIELTQPLRPLGSTGEYRVEFRVVASDGHPLTSEMWFTLTKPGPAAGGAMAVVPPAPLAEVSTSVNNAPSWESWLGGALTVLLVAGAVMFGRRVTRDLD